MKTLFFSCYRRTIFLCFVLCLWVAYSLGWTELVKGLDSGCPSGLDIAANLTYIFLLLVLFANSS